MTGEKKDLTFFEAASVVTGYGVGGGIMTVPYLTSLSGILPLFMLLIVGYTISILLHLMIVEMMLRDDGSSQMVEVLNKYLFRGKGGAIFTWIFFILIIFGFYASLLAYVAGGGEILNKVMSVPEWAGQIIFYAIAASVVFFGLKVVGMSEKYAIFVIFFVVAILVGNTLLKPFKLDFEYVGGVKDGLALFGMIMFSFASFFSVPQAVEGLSWDKKKAPWAVIAGIGMTFVFILVITLMALGTAGGSGIPVTEIAIEGWAEALGGIPFYLGNIFVLLAMLTSFWAISLALAVVLQERLGWKEKIAWLVSTLPCLIIVILIPLSFLDYMGIAGGIIGVLIAILMVPAYVSTRKHGVVKNPEWSLGFWGGWIFLTIVVIGYIMMAVGAALIP